VAVYRLAVCTNKLEWLSQTRSGCKRNAIQERQQELSNLMARASEGGGGVLIGTMAYRADYENAIGEEKVLRGLNGETGHGRSSRNGVHVRFHYNQFK
jgi:hypothetical protein